MLKLSTQDLPLEGFKGTFLSAARVCRMQAFISVDCFAKRLILSYTLDA